ncbi:CPBP family intramembrane glutamic endopeptidase [Actinoplanes utahensis]|uniref:CPBP family intramembrane glutamic endopeptidase n=1 Tax=Actinoplanes utahensis TaxID=1869 RepID=UPI00068F860B|nr:CPBP family intramembrane glutamic endopeptidase [Actinoplanes utahensis]GIF30239.1 hypothetical protein Aut01nite_32250 [Actinoplanes utahensis]
MSDGATVYSYVLLVTVYGLLLASTVHAIVRRRTLLAGLAARRAAFYRNGIVNMVVLAGLAVLIVGLNPDLTMAGAGWTWPDGVWTDYFYTGGILVLLAGLFLKSRRNPQPETSTALLPRTAGERRLAGAGAFAFGIGEEILYRGLLLAAGTDLLGLPTAVVAAAGLVIFTAGHAYQGWRGMFSIGLLGYLLTMLYLSSTSLLLPILMHIVWDLVALLLVRVPVREQPVPPSPSTVPPDSTAPSTAAPASAPASADIEVEAAADVGTEAGVGDGVGIRLRSPIPR